MIYSSPSTTVEIVADNFATGLGGTIGYRLRDNQGADAIARTTAGITEDIAASGVYRAQFTAPAAAGQYTVVWDSGGASPTYATEELVVTSTTLSLAAPAGSDLCSLAEVRAALELRASDTSMDDAISRLIPTASKAVAEWTQREFTPTTSATRRFRTDGRLVSLAPYDLRAVTTATFDPAGGPAVMTTPNDYRLQPTNQPEGVYTELRISDLFAVETGTWVQFGFNEVDILGAWGFASVPYDVKEAAIIAIRSWLRRDTTTYAQVDGDTRQLQPDAFGTYKLPPATKAMLDPYKRMVV